MSRPMVVTSRGRLRPAVVDAGLAAGLCTLDLLVSWSPDRGGDQPAWLVPAFAAAGYAALLARRRRPRTVLALVIAHSLVAGLLLNGYLPTLGVWIALYTVASRCDLRSASIGLAAALVPSGLNVADAVGRQLPQDRAAALVGTTVALVLFDISIFAVGRWAAWSVRQRQLVAESAHAAATAAERARIARDLHDVVAHSVTLMLLQAGGAARIVATDPDRAATALAHVDAIGQQAIVELRRLLGLLRVDEEAESSSGGSLPGLARLEELISRAGTDGLAISLQVSGVVRALEPGVDLTAYRILQEALTNASRYAPRPSEISLALRWTPDRLEIQATSDLDSERGAGTVSRLSGGHGLRVMAERARSAGGDVRAAREGGRFVVRASLPTAAVSGRCAA